MSSPVDASPTPYFHDNCGVTLGILSDLIQQRQPVFAMPSWFVTADNAAVGMLLSELVRELSQGGPGTTYRSFLANSRYEALHGAVKLVRHSRLDTVRHHGGRVLVLDPDGTLARRADPLGVGPERALVPGVECHASLAGLTAAVDSGRGHCGLVVREPERFDLDALAVLATRCRAAGARVVLDLADLDVRRPQHPAVLALRPDLVVLGESLTGREVPFGAFVGTHEVFSAWSTPETAFLHSNTYGGNSVAMRRVRAALADRWPAGTAVRRRVDALDTDWELVLRAYARHVNPQTVRLHRSVRGALRVVRADGSRLTVQLDSGRRLELVDGLCGAGLGINGHNPQDAATEVVARHDESRDYLGELERTLERETGLPHLFPAVSGASAVETAMTLAVLARPRKRRVVVFRHNYGGKTLVSLLATAADATRAPFGPLYDDVRYVDPFAEDAAERLTEELASGEVGLVWVELVHGSSSTFAPIPDHLLQIVAEERERLGFLVGVDEILTSYYRCGRRFAYQGRLPEVDLVTLSKALSYGCFPTGAALVSDAVLSAAREVNPRLVDELRAAHANQLGAHFGLHAVHQVDALGVPERAAALSRVVADGLAAMDPRSATVGRRFAEGMLGRLEVLPPKLLRRFLSGHGDALGHVLMLWWITQARVFVVYDVFLLPLNASEREIRHVMRQAGRLSRTSPWALLARVGWFLATESALGRLRRPTRRR